MSGEAGWIMFGLFVLMACVLWCLITDADHHAAKRNDQQPARIIGLGQYRVEVPEGQTQVPVPNKVMSEIIADTLRKYEAEQRYIMERDYYRAATAPMAKDDLYLGTSSNTWGEVLMPATKSNFYEVPAPVTVAGPMIIGRHTVTKYNAEQYIDNVMCDVCVVARFTCRDKEFKADAKVSGSDLKRNGNGTALLYETLSKNIIAMLDAEFPNDETSNRFRELDL